MRISKILLTSLIIFSVIFSIGYFVSPVYSFENRIGGNDDDKDEEDSNSQQDEIEELEDEIKELEEKLDKLERQEKTLQGEIDNYNSQIQLTKLRIQQSLTAIKKKEEEIIRLAGDIEDLKLRIDKLIDKIGYQETVLGERLRERYKTRETSPFIVVFGSSTVSSLIKKAEYLKVMERQDKKLLDQMNKTKKAYGLQKNLFEDKKEEEEVLKQQLEVEKVNLEQYDADLERQKAEKDALLKQTQNDEKKFQEKLEDAQRELNQMLTAVSVLKDQKPRNVKKGEIIGVQGNTGYSFGEHLHFGVYKYSSFEDITGWNWYYSNHVNPAKKLKNKNVNWNTGCEGSTSKSVGEGKWTWPVSGPTVSQGYGNTCWSSIYYGGNPHPAYDMYGSTGAPVYAAEKGEAYFCKNCLGDGGNGVFIFHPDDYMTVYWHLR